MLITGLAANAAYGVSIQTVGNGQVISITPGSGGAADGAGVLRLTF